MNQEIIKFVIKALQCSIFVDPLDPWLSFDELVELGSRLDFQRGEIGDNLQYAVDQFFGKGAPRLQPNKTVIASWMFLEKEDPEFRNFDAFDFVVGELNERARADGAAKACIPRDIIVERAIASGIYRHDIEVAITYQVIANMLTEKDGILRFPGNSGVRGLPSEQIKSARSGLQRPDMMKKHIYDAVRDVLSRRNDGRAKHAEPLDAFSEDLARLGYGKFALWWGQIVGELRRCDPNSAPVSAAVLSASLVEAALSFVVQHARAKQLGVFKSNDFAGSPRTWRLDELVRSAASGGDSAILDTGAKTRVESLMSARQRIHAGRMLSDFPGGPPDLRPEEARDAKATAEQLVRCVLDWLQKFPP